MRTWCGCWPSRAAPRSASSISRSVAKGADAIRIKLAELAGAGVQMAIIDAVFDPDLETIGLVALDHQLSVGASGIGLGLARGLVTTGRVRARPAGSSLGAPVGGPAACLAGSCSQATLAQIARAEAAMPVLRLDPEALITEREPRSRARSTGPPSASPRVRC